MIIYQTCHKVILRKPNMQLLLLYSIYESSYYINKNNFLTGMAL
jgi:hypothetical protein